MLCFLHLPKTGGSTLNGALRRSYGLRHVDVISLDGHDTAVTARDITFATRLHPGARSISSHRLCINHGLGDHTWKWFTMVREPVARTISEYQFYRNRLGGDLNLEGYVEKKQIRNLQVCRIAGTADVDLAVKTLRNDFFFTGMMERFDESLGAIETLSDEPQLSTAYVRRNTASDRSIAAAMRSDPGIMRYISEITDLDAELFAVVRDELYPAGIAKAKQRGQIPAIDQLDPSPYDPKLIANRVVRNGWYKPAAKLAQLVRRQR